MEEEVVMIMSSDEIWHGENTNARLTDVVDGKADANHTHAGYAAADHSHTGYAAEEHTHSGYATTEQLNEVAADVGYVEDALAEKANADHSHTGYAAADHTHAGYAAAEHTHSGYAATDHSHTGYAAAEHTHSGYASEGHTHTGYAASEHTHSEYAAANHAHAGYASADALSDLETEVEGKAEASHTHAQSDVTGLATALQGKADASHTHDYAASGHTHTPAAIGAATANHTHTPASIGAAAASHTHDYADADHTHTAAAVGAASADHTHTPAGIGAAAANHTHDYAAADHTHTPASIGAAASNHSHSGYAAASHTHDYAASGHTHTPASIGAAAATHTHDYLSTNGGTVNGDVNVAGVIRGNGQQAYYYADSTKSQTLGTNNATGGTNIACGPDATCNIGGAIQKTASVLPRNTNTFLLGNTNFRWKGIYSAAAVNVSSDERLKRDIATTDGDALAAFINALQVKTYNYKDDAEDAKARIGLIAQEVQQADAELAEFFVDTGEDGMLNLRPADLVFPLIAAVQELSARVAELEARN